MTNVEIDNYFICQLFGLPILVTASYTLLELILYSVKHLYVAFFNLVFSLIFIKLINKSKQYTIFRGRMALMINSGACHLFFYL